VVKGKDLVTGLVEQAATAAPTYLLDRTATDLVCDEAAGTVTVTLDETEQVVAKAVIITAGIGKFSPRPLPAADAWTGGGVAFFVPSFEGYVGKDVVIVGGGDSAFDWALALEPLAASVTLVHRRDAFRAHQATVDKVMASSTRIITNANVAQLMGEGRVTHVEVEHVKTKEVTTLKCQAVVAALGFVADLGPIQQWGIEVQKRHVVVDSTTRTNLPRVFAAGDITEYPGKVRLIAVGFGEAATAVNNAAVTINPEAHLFPGHSSEG
jgi:thioredoxin reductase (NADPH)